MQDCLLTEALQIPCILVVRRYQEKILHLEIRENQDEHPFESLFLCPGMGTLPSSAGRLAGLAHPVTPHPAAGGLA